MKKFIFLCFTVLSWLLIIDLGPANSIEAEHEFHGQFRINSYFQSADNDAAFGEDKDITASRLRFRPTWDSKFDNDVALHLQLNIGHVNSNVFNSRYTLDGDPSTEDPVVSLRHGHITAPLPAIAGAENLRLVAGIIPMSDKFGDTLFSGDWDYNPLTVEILGNASGIDIRLAYANLDENREGDHPADDVKQWFFDADTDLGIGVSFYHFRDNSRLNTITTANRTIENYAGVRYATTVSNMDVNAFAIYNWGTRTFETGPIKERDNSGFAVKASVKVPVGNAKIALMGIYASGDKDFGDSAKSDSDAFITPMSIVGTTGYYGYTGKLNVQGPTDTGIDHHFVNIDGGGANSTNLGLGLTTIQVNVSLPLIEDKLDGYAAVGWFTHNDSMPGFDKDIGTDLYVQAKYHISDSLTFEAGVDYALLEEGHADSTSLGLSKKATRDVFLLFSRLQLEF